MRLAKYAWISVLTVASCHPEQDTEPKTLDFGRFTIVVPGYWQAVIKTGYDSYVGGIRAGGLGEIEFDYGRFASNLDVDPDTQETFWPPIDGRNATPAKPRRRRKGT